MTKPIDEQQRQQALDTTQSFIVQAPAGSGKTELLIQRYLALLGNAVTNPEEIIAITFTRKAAAEMRQRILAGLHFAIEQPEPDNASVKYRTWQLAKKVLAVNIERQWCLLDNPNRLRIQTIDALCAGLTAQMPILSGFGAQPKISDDVNALYKEAARQTLETLEEKCHWSEDLHSILLYLQNDFDKVQELFVAMLQCRDQWLAHVINPNPRSTLEQALQNTIREQLINIKNSLINFNYQELIQLINFAISNLDPNSSLFICKNLSILPETSYEYLSHWQAIAKFLLTQDYQWRKQYNKNNGFPAGEKIKPLKQRMLALIATLEGNEDLRLQLINTLQLPPPHYSEFQWQIMQSLINLLPILVAHLNLIFKHSNTVDHTEISLKALEALGTPEEPTDLTLALDYKIKHILVDEFQDTSLTQFRLLETLTSGWNNSDGRTLFVVGDPMQSIYRFRKAEVGLFLNTKAKGLGNVKLKFLQLQVNFRSINNIVDWNNQIFQQIFPKKDDLTASSICFAKSAAHTQSTQNQSIFLYANVAATETKEAEIICEIINSKSSSNEKIAILVLARSHLLQIIPALQRANIHYRAIDLETLFHQPVIQDLFALTRACLYPEDIIAWYAILRAPWCGLSLADLLIIKQNNTGIIWQALSTYEQLSLSNNAKLQLKTFVPILEMRLAQQSRGQLSVWLEQTWLMLGGPACYNNKESLHYANSFFACISELEVGGGLVSLEHLQTKLENLKISTPKNSAESAPADPGNKVEIMTIHSAKGLEFDTVILPSLHKKTANDRHQLLIWQECPRAHGDAELILAPIKTSKTDNIYDYLRRQESIKANNELTRLLYVATTRAKSQLHLIANVHIDIKDPTKIKLPASGSMLDQLWPIFASEFDKQTKYPLIATTKFELPKSYLQRLSNDWINPVNLFTPQELTAYKSKKIPIAVITPTSMEQTIGIVVHAILRDLTNIGVEYWHNLSKETKHAKIAALLKQQQITVDYLDIPIITVLTAIDNSVNDQKGLWILKQAGAAEFAINYLQENKVNNYIVDRTFIENKTRWIIDYKTSAPKNENLNEFLQREKHHYFSQLQHYAQAFHQFDSLPIKLGLYFPLVSGWIEWDYEPCLLMCPELSSPSSPN